MTMILLLLGASLTAEASSFRVSVNYDRHDYDECRAVSCQHDLKKVVYITEKYPRCWVRNYADHRPYYHVYAPARRYCYMWSDRYGRKIRKCYLYSQGFSHPYDGQAGRHDQRSRYCRRK